MGGGSCPHKTEGVGAWPPQSNLYVATYSSSVASLCCSGFEYFHTHVGHAHHTYAHSCTPAHARDDMKRCESSSSILAYFSKRTHLESEEANTESDHSDSDLEIYRSEETESALSTDLQNQSSTIESQTQ